MRKLLSLMLLVALVTAGLGAWTPAAQAADTGNAAPQTGKIVSDEPGKNAPNILDGTTYSIAKVGNTIVVGGQFTQVQNYNTSTTVTRANVLAFDATTGKLLTTFAPDPDGTVYKVLPATDGQSVYVAGSFNSAGGQAMPGHLFKINVTTGTIDPGFTAQIISGEIRDLDVVGNHLFIGGKFTHINGIAQKALGTVYADTGKRDPYFNSVLAGLHNPSKAGAVTNVLQLSVNKQNNALVAVGNFMTVDGQSRAQIAKWDIGNAPTGVDTTVHQTLSTWTAPMFAQACSSAFDTNMTDVEYAPNGNYFVVSTTGAYGGSGSLNGTSGCDVVARFENTATAGSAATWTAYTGGDTTWTVEVTDNVVYVGGHQRWQNNPTAADQPGQGAVSREGIAALNTVNGLPFSWNPTRSRGTGVQDMLATSDGLYVGSDTDLIGHTAGNTYHARIAVLPLAGGATLPQLQATALPVDLYRVAAGASQLQKRSFTGTTAGTATNVPTGPGWGTSTGAFMVNGILYKTNTDGTLSKMTFDGTNYGTVSAVNTSDALVFQSDWHNDAKTLTSLFYANGNIYYTKTGTNALYRRSFEVEDGVVGQQRFSTTTGSINYANTRGAFVVGNKLFFANTTGNMYTATWDPSTHNIVPGTLAAVTTAGTGWASRAFFFYQAVPPPLNEPPVAAATVSCDQLVCSFDATGSTDPENGPLTYDWDFGDGSAHGTTGTATHTYDSAGDRPVTLVVTDNKGATNSVSRTASPTSQADSITFVNSNNNNGNRTNHSITVPSGTQVGDTLLLFFAANSTGPVYAGPAGWTQVLTQNGSSSVGKLFTKTATAADLGATVTVTSKNTDGTTYYVRSDTTLAAYRGVGSPAISASAITAQNVATAVHQTPTVNASDGNKWLVSFWTDKSSATTGWTGPAGQTQRSEGAATGTSHMSSLLTDSNSRVNSGAEGGLNATADSSAQGLTMSLLLTSAGPAPANQSPVAHASLVGCTDLTCSFDGASSSDPDGGALTYDWDWGDGTGHGTTATPSHTFISGGNKSVTLTVTDPQNATGVDTVTATPTAPLVNQAPTAHITGAGCTNLVCTVNGSTSSDPDGDTLTYDWDWGDTSTHDTTANPSHTYAAGGARTVTLTVNDAHGHTATDSTTLNPTSSNPVSHVAFVGAASSNGNRQTHATTLPSGVQVGDTLIAFFTANTLTPTYTGPTGWTLLETKDGNGIAARAWTKTATATEAAANAKVTVTSSSYAKSDLTVSVYRGLDGTTPIAASASKTDDAAGAAHVSPAVTAADTTSWLVTYWADKSTDTTGFTAPAGQTVRQAAATVSSSGHITALLVDGNGPVPSGANGQLTATANSASSRGDSFSVLLKSSP